MPEKSIKISGFTMVKNATKLYYPIKASIQSILPIVDEYIIALGDCDIDDNTRKEIESIGSPKIKIIDTVWDLNTYPNGMENAHQTDIAKSYCKGDWLFYLQADEVVHEKDLMAIKNKCGELNDDMEIEGLLFDYYHFWGNYEHHQVTHGWYKNEIRIIRNRPEIHSWESAQSFRRIPGFDGINYRIKEGAHKLKVAKVNAHIYHYGWVRPPQYMQKKRKALDTIHKGKKRVNTIYEKQNDEFDYGPLKLAKKFTGTHPKTMEEWLGKFNWQNKLRMTGPVPTNRNKFKHEKIKYRLLSFLEQKILGGRTVGDFKNYILVKRK